MSIFGFLKPDRPAPPAELDIPLFPLKSVLYPGGTLALKVFEQRYLDMSADCLKHKKPFNIYLILKSKKINKPTTIHSIDTLAHVTQ